MGELIEMQAVQPSAAQRKADAKGRVGNTVTQVGVPAFLVTIATWAAQLARLDLDPGAGTDMPTIVTAAWVGLLTWAMARFMNRDGYNASDGDTAEVTDLRERITALEARLAA